VSASPSDAPTTVHIVDDAGSWYGSNEVVALCGQRGHFDEDGDLLTSGFAFVEPPDESMATCTWCRDTRGLATLPSIR
jgi:hypothetical protein